MNGDEIVRLVFSFTGGFLAATFVVALAVNDRKATWLFAIGAVAFVLLAIFGPL